MSRETYRLQSVTTCKDAEQSPEFGATPASLNFKDYNLCVNYLN